MKKERKKRYFHHSHYKVDDECEIQDQNDNLEARL